MLTGRSEGFIAGRPDLAETIRRLVAYAEAGADVLYAPGLADAAEIAAVTSAVSRPVNVLARPSLSVAEIADAGARRISVGGSLTWAATEALGAIATRMLEDGDLSGLRGGRQVYEWLGAQE
jgi:2-methylisocitrate lyase-like PEP mutase family enzyme